MSDSTIQNLINEGVVVLYHDYRSRSFRDWSGNGNHGVPSSGVGKPGRDGVDIFGSNYIEVADSPELRLTEGTLLFFSNLDNVNIDVTNRAFISKESGAIEYRLHYNYTASGRWRFISDDLADIDASTYTPSHIIATNFKDGDDVDFYGDGVFLASDGPVGVSTGTAVLRIGNMVATTTVPLKTKAKAAIITNRQLTSTEHSQVYDELMSKRWPTRSYGKSIVLSPYPKPGQGEGLLLSNQLSDGEFSDLSGNGNDGVADAGVLENRTFLGRMPRFDGNGKAVVVSDDASIQPTTQVTFAAVVRAKDLGHAGGGGDPRIASKGTPFAIYYDNGNSRFVFGTSDLSASDLDGNSAITTNDFCLVGATYDSSTEIKRLLINGITDRAESGITGTIDTAGNDLIIGDRSGRDRSWYGDIGSPYFNISEAKSESWFSDWWNCIAKATQYKTDWGACESVVSETSGYLSNTNIEILADAWKVSYDTIDSDVCKIMTTPTGGDHEAAINLLNVETPTGALYGTLTFWIYIDSDTTSTRRIALFDAPNDSSSSGYSIAFYESSGWKTAIQKYDGGFDGNISISDGGSFSPDTWIKVSFMLRYDGQKSLYIDDNLVDSNGGGTNPVVDNDIQSGGYIYFKLKEDDKISLGDRKGGHSLIKQLGAQVPTNIPTIQNDQSALNATELEIECPSSGVVSIDWGDGSISSVTCDGTLNSYIHNYASTGQYVIRVLGTVGRITDFRCYSQSWISGDLANITAGMTSMERLLLDNTGVTGDISALAGMTSITLLFLNSTGVVGDISSLSGMTLMERLYLNSTGVVGDISSLSGMTLMEVLYLYSTGFVGDISALAGMTSMERLRLYDTGVSDYTSTTIPAGWSGIDFRCDNCGFSSSELDQLIIDFEAGAGDPDMDCLTGNGPRTAASDAAVAAIIAAGGSVT